MLTFFHGWRRKMGCVVLPGACLFMAAWMRSYATCDILEATGNVVLASGYSSMILVLDKDVSSPDSTGWEWPGWSTVQPSELDADLQDVNWQFQWIGFCQGDIRDSTALSL